VYFLCSLCYVSLIYKNENKYVSEENVLFCLECKNQLKQLKLERIIKDDFMEGSAGQLYKHLHATFFEDNACDILFLLPASLLNLHLSLTSDLSCLFL